MRRRSRSKYTAWGFRGRLCVVTFGALAAAGAIYAAPESPPHPVENASIWPTFHADNRRTGIARTAFRAAPFRRVWTFNLGRHTWSYCQGASVWSASAVSGDVGGRRLLFIGAYDHNLYAIDPDSGKEAWRYTTGCIITAAPAFAVVGGTPMVFVASADRSVYGLDAATGQKKWQFETYSWTYTIGESLAGSPLVESIDARPVLFVTMWNSDRKALRTVQAAELFALDPSNGTLLWRTKLSTAPLTAPAFLRVDGDPLLFVGSEDGSLYGCNARNGKIVAHVTTGHKIIATPVCTTIARQPIVFVANGFGMLRAISASRQTFIWKYKAGHEILSTPALLKANGKLMLVFGCSDRFVHAVEAKTGRRIWRFMTRKFVVASPAIAAVRGRPMIFINSLDNRLYGLDAFTGCEILRFASGDMLWPYETRGASIWASPSIHLRNSGEPLLLFPAHDGNLYAFEAGAAAPGAKDAKVNPDALGFAESQGVAPHRAPPWARYVPLVGLLLWLSGAASVLFIVRRQPVRPHPNP